MNPGAVWHGAETASRPPVGRENLRDPPGRAGFRADPETNRVSPPCQRPWPPEEPSDRRNNGKRPAVPRGQRCGCGKGGGLCHGSGVGGSGSELSSLWAGKGNTLRFPARARQSPADRSVREQRQVSARPGGGKAPAMGGSCAWVQRGAVAGAMAPASGAVKLLWSVRAGPGNTPRFPRLRATPPQKSSQRAHRQASARPGGREASAKGGAGAGRGLWPPAGQGSAWCCGRGDGPC
jgi:hypothetical protein